MVCELILLLKTMLIAKKRDHALYEITRTKEYRENVWELSNLYSTPQEEIFAIAMRQDAKAMERFMINNPNIDYLTMHDENGSSLIHFISQQGNVKMMTFLFSFVPLSKMEKLINSKGVRGQTPLMVACTHFKYETVEVSYFPASIIPLKPMQALWYIRIFTVLINHERNGCKCAR